VAIASFALGLLALSGTCVALVPLLNVVNCFALPAALFGVILGVADLMRTQEGEDRDGLAVAGVVLGGLVLLVGGTRMLISLMTTGGIL